MKNTKQEVNKNSKKYWEAETPIVTETTYAEIRFYEKAGKVQLYPKYEDKVGEMQVGRACVWDNTDISSDEAVSLAYGIMRALLDSGVENDAFADAYAILEEAYNESVEDEESEDEIATQGDDEELDEEFEDEENDYSEMSLAELRAECKERGIKYTSKNKEDLLIQYLEEYDKFHLDNDDEEEDVVDRNAKIEKDTNSYGYIGGKLMYMDGKVERTNKKVGKVYLDWCDDAIEWTNYIVETSDEISNMPTKTAKQKKEQNVVYAQLKEDIDGWIEEWEDNKIMANVKKITDALMFGKISAGEAISKFVAIIDKMQL